MSETEVVEAPAAKAVDALTDPKGMDRFQEIMRQRGAPVESEPVEAPVAATETVEKPAPVESAVSDDQDDYDSAFKQLTSDEVGWKPGALRKLGRSEVIRLAFRETQRSAASQKEAQTLRDELATLRSAQQPKTPEKEAKPASPAPSDLERSLAVLKEKYGDDLAGGLKEVVEPLAKELAELREARATESRLAQEKVTADALRTVEASRKRLLERFPEIKDDKKFDSLRPYFAQALKEEHEAGTEFTPEKFDEVLADVARYRKLKEVSPKKRDESDTRRKTELKGNASPGDPPEFQAPEDDPSGTAAFGLLYKRGDSSAVKAWAAKHRR